MLMGEALFLSSKIKKKMVEPALFDAQSSLTSSQASVILIAVRPATSNEVAHAIFPSAAHNPIWQPLLPKFADREHGIDRTPELKPRLGSAADGRRRTLSNLLDVSADSDARRLVLKKTKNIPDGVKKWADSFDLLLSDEGGVEVFRIFLRSEYSEENMRFYTACEELKHARSFRVGPRAKRIYKTFIEDHAPMEVNLDFETKKSIRDAMKSPHRTMFDEAQRKIREMLSADAYPRFIRSDFYKGLLNS